MIDCEAHRLLSFNFDIVPTSVNLARF